jgi:hypothetical protein
LYVNEYFAVPPLTADPSGTVKSIQRVASLPATGGDGPNPCDKMVKAVWPAPQSVTTEDESDTAIRAINILRIPILTTT